MTCSNCYAPIDPPSGYCRSCGAKTTVLLSAAGVGSDVGRNGAAGHVFERAGYPPVIAENERANSDNTPAELAETLRSPLPVGIGTIIDGKYRLEAVLGKGGMGTVFRAARLEIDDEVAIKVLHPESVADPDARERFKREARAAARIKHDNVVSVYDFGITKEGLGYLVMELIHGESLREIIKQRRWLTPEQCVPLLNQICDALDEAHGKSIVHRDLKPDNIMVQPGKRQRVKVVDFGIAKLRDVTGSGLTSAGFAMGTPHYMSPEQCGGDSVDHRSDLYSLGIVLYEMLTGVVPFRKPSRLEVWLEHAQQPPPPLRTVNAAIPAKVEAVVLRALAKNPDHRPQSALELAEAFSKASEVVAPSPPPPPPVPLPPTPVVSSKWTTILLIGIAAVGLLAIGALTVLLFNNLWESVRSDERGTAQPVPEPSIVINTPASTPAASTPAPTPVAEVPLLNREYVGKINGNVDFSITFDRLEGDRLEGKAITPGDVDRLVGRISNGAFDLEATNVQTSEKGWYKGRLRDGRISGSWTGEKHKDPIQFWAVPK